jgi:hypothetical protein
MAEYQQEMAIVRNNDSVFASPWNDSDLVLVVEDQEIHVHKWILKSQSPVFKAMFDGQFREAGQERIVLSEKNFESMVAFLKALYPSAMFGEGRSGVKNESLLSVLELADEYQCVNLIKQCINEAEIKPKIIIKIFPFVVKYHKTALPKLYDVMKWSFSVEEMQVFVLPQLESKQRESVLLTKCCFLESTVVQLQKAVICLITEFLEEAKRDTVAVDECSLHRILDVKDVDITKECEDCKENYYDNFIPPFLNSCMQKQAFKRNLLKLLQESHDIAESAIPLYE